MSLSLLSRLATPSATSWLLSLTLSWDGKPLLYNSSVSSCSSGHCRQGAFSCQPDLATYTGDSGTLAGGDPENEPPSLCTAAADLPPEDSDEGEEEEEGEEWASVEVRTGKERGRLEYQSGYLEFLSLGDSREPDTRGEREGEEGRTAGLFATISSLFSSTFSQTNT
jgi:hypothetical protein